MSRPRRDHPRARLEPPSGRADEALRAQDRALAMRAVASAPWSYVQVSFDPLRAPGVVFWCRVCEERLRGDSLREPPVRWECETCNYAIEGDTLAALVQYYRAFLDDVSPPRARGSMLKEWWTWICERFSAKR